MQHNLKQIAQNHNFDYDKFLKFALDNQDKYSLEVHSDYTTVSSWHSYALIEDFKTYLAEADTWKKVSDDLFKFTTDKGYFSQPLNIVMPLILEYLKENYNINHK